MRSSIKYFLISLVPFSMMMAGCTTPKTHGIKIETVEVPVVQVQKCLDVKDVPARPKTLKSEGLPSDLEKALSVALAKVSEWTRYGNKVDVIVKGCVE